MSSVTQKLEVAVCSPSTWHRVVSSLGQSSRSIAQSLAVGKNTYAVIDQLAQFFRSSNLHRSGSLARGATLSSNVRQQIEESIKFATYL